MVKPSGTRVWTCPDFPSRRAPSAYATDCYVDRLGKQWVVLVVRGPETVTSETWDSEANAARRATELLAAIEQSR